MEDKYANAKAARAKHSDAIVASSSRKKLVVAGPGTGKTHLFKRVLEGRSKAVTLSFVNSLVADLALELCGLSDVKTLHGFARGILTTKKHKVLIYPKLSTVIREDANILLGRDIDFDELFNNKADANEHISFYKSRKDYYGHYGYADVVFAAVRLFETNPERVPSYDQVIVDEFQDLNELEVSLIDQLANRSPVLLTGDDDQALYAFKNASPDHIRKRHSDPGHGYAAFNLPYCSRCPRVVVDACNDIIGSAAKNGRLSGRIDKPFVYFDDASKDKISDQYPKIVHARLQATQIPWFIEKEIAGIAEELRGSFQVLIISPTKTQSRTIVSALRKKGLRNIDFADRKDEAKPTLLDGLKLMLETDQKYGNLGWRIAAGQLLSAEELGAALRKSSDDPTVAFHERLNKDAKTRINELSQTLRRLRDKGEVDDEALDDLLAAVGINSRELAATHLKTEIDDDRERFGNPSIRTIPIKATTIQSSKGLAADYVFITHFDDRYFVKDRDKTKVSDQDVCNYLVALTRAKRKVYLVSSNPNEVSALRTWIDSKRIEEYILGTREQYQTHK